SRYYLDEELGRRILEEASTMPREAKLFLSSSGSAVRGFFKFRANIPPRWIKNAQQSRKRMEPEIVKAFRSLKSIQRNRPRTQVALKNAKKQFKAVLSRWETAYNKEHFYRGITYPPRTSAKWLFGVVTSMDYFRCLLTALVI